MLTIEEMQPSKPNDNHVPFQYPTNEDQASTHLALLFSPTPFAISPILRLLVLLVNKHPSPAALSNLPNSSCLIPRFSIIASTTKSAPDTAPIVSVVNVIFARTDAGAGASGCFARRARDSSMIFRPFSTAASVTSESMT